MRDKTRYLNQYLKKSFQNPWWWPKFVILGSFIPGGTIWPFDLQQELVTYKEVGLMLQ